jgi:hypothetical protein
MVHSISWWRYYTSAFVHDGGFGPMNNIFFVQLDLSEENNAHMQITSLSKHSSGL